MKQFAKMCFLVALVLLVTGITVMAQSDVARVIGTVTDQSGAAVPGATIRITNLATNRTVTAQSQPNGEYVANALPIGSYKIEANKDTFKAESANVTLEISQVKEVNFKLQIGSATETVNVTDEVPLVDTATSSAGEIIQGRQVVELPLNGRNFTSLALLTPGVSRGAYADQATGSNNQAETWRNSESGGAALVVNGVRAQANNYIIDGVDNNESLVNTVVIFPTVEDISEFKVTTSTSPAEFGRAGGAVVQVATKSGTNSIHGSGYWFARSREAMALPWGWGKNPAPELKRNQFGASLGGPIWKNRIFGFMDYQGWRQSSPQSDNSTRVPTAKMRGGDFSEIYSAAGKATATSLPYSGLPGCAAAMAANPTAFNASMGYIFNPQTCLPFGWDAVAHQAGTGINVMPTASQNAIGLRYLNAFPLANIAGANASTNDPNFAPRRQQIKNLDDYDYRLDFVLNSKETVFARFSSAQDLLNLSDRLKDGSHDLPSGYGSGSNPQHPRQIAIGYTRILSDRVINEFRYGWSRPYFGYQQPGYGTPQAANLGIPNANTSPLLGGMALIGGWHGNVEYVGDYGPYVVNEPSNQFTDALTWTKGAHTLKFGFSILRRNVDFTQANVAKGYFWIDDNNEPQYSGFPGQYSGNGTFTGHEISELAGGFMAAYQIGAFNGYYKTRSWENGFFAQDDFRVNRKLMLNLGLRYDFLTWPDEASNRQSNFDPKTGTLIVGGTTGWPSALVNTPTHNFGPRIGFSYDVSGNGKTVVRGGYGLFYFLDRGGVGTQLSNNPDFNGSQTYYACPTLTTCGNGYRVTLSGAAPLGSTNPNNTVANGSLPVGVITFDPTHLSSADNVIYYPRNSPNSHIQQWNIQVERALNNSTSLNLGYVGASMTNLATSFNANATVLGGSTKWFSGVGSINEYGMVGSGNYNGLQARLNHKMSHGLLASVSYTWSHTLDNAAGALSNGAGGSVYMGANGTPLLHYNYGNANSDQRQMLVASALYELPFGKGHMFLNNVPKALDFVVGGWQFNNVINLISGTPIDVTVGGIHPDYHGGCSVKNSGNVWMTCPTSAFTFPAGLVGNLERNYFHGPGTHTWDTSLSKTFKVTERVKTEFRAQVYNLTNTPQFNSPDTNAGNWSGTTFVPNTDFGKVSSPRTESERELELALRVSF